MDPMDPMNPDDPFDPTGPSQRSAAPKILLALVGSDYVVATIDGHPADR